MHVPPFQPPFGPGGLPAPAPIAYGPPVSVAVLQAPLWGPQPAEGAAEHRAFLAWLMGGYALAAPMGRPGPGGQETPVPKCRGDWSAALGVLGCTRVALERLSLQWSWQLRGDEYWSTVRAIGEASATNAAQGVLEYAALARELDRKWLKLSILEVDKAIVEALRTTPDTTNANDPKFLPRLFSNRELIALRRADGALEIQRFRAGVLEKRAEDTQDAQAVQWARLDANQLEQYRILREVAREGTGT